MVCHSPSYSLTETPATDLDCPAKAQITFLFALDHHETFPYPWPLSRDDFCLQNCHLRAVVPAIRDLAKRDDCDDGEVLIYRPRADSCASAPTPLPPVPRSQPWPSRQSTRQQRFPPAGSRASSSARCWRAPRRGSVTTATRSRFRPMMRTDW